MPDFVDDNFENDHTNIEHILGYDDGENFGNMIENKILQEMQNLKNLNYDIEYIQNWCDGLNDKLATIYFGPYDADTINEKGVDTDAAST